MKKILMTLAAVLCCAMTTTTLTSCSIEDNPAPVTDYKPFTYDSEIDNSVRPGDDFYRYALGQWLNSIFLFVSLVFCVAGSLLIAWMMDVTGISRYFFGRKAIN